MIKRVYFEGVKATVRNFNIRFYSVVGLMIVSMIFTGCQPSTTANSNGTAVDLNETAATVNGKAIKLEEVERGLKQQTQGQEGRLSQLELAAARLQILETLIQQEVMFQKAEKEQTVPTEEEVTAEYNRTLQQSGMSKEQVDKMMKDSGQTEASARESLKKSLAIKKLVDKVTGKIEPPKDSEIDAFYNGNKEAFVKKRGVKLAAIVVDPANNGEGDTTVDEQSAVLKGNEILKKLQAGADFATVARESSEDPQSKLQGGDLGYVSEEQMKQTFPQQITATLMNPEFQVGRILPTPMMGKFYILKLQERSDKDENLTLESPGVRQRVTDELINSRKQLLAASYQAIAMNEAKVVNNLAQNVVDHPNELSGARPASAEPANTNTNAAMTNTNTAAVSNTNSATNANSAKTNTTANAANKANTNAGK